MGRIFKYGPEERLTAEEVLEEPFFQKMRKNSLENEENEDSQDHLRTTARTGAQECSK